MARKKLLDGTEIPKDSQGSESIINNEAVYVSAVTTKSNVYSVFLGEEIIEQMEYRPLYSLLRDAGKTDVFLMYINNFGGQVHSGLELINSMKACEGIVSTVITGPLYSMAPLIALQGTRVFVEDDIFFMFHDYSGQDGTMKGNEALKAVTHFKTYFDNFFTRATKGFLSTKEQKKVLSGEDLYLARDEVMARLKSAGKLGNAE